MTRTCCCTPSMRAAPIIRPPRPGWKKYLAGTAASACPGKQSVRSSASLRIHDSPRIRCQAPTPGDTWRSGSRSRWCGSRPRRDHGAGLRETVRAGPDHGQSRAGCATGRSRRRARSGISIGRHGFHAVPWASLDESAERLAARSVSHTKSMLRSNPRPTLRSEERRVGKECRL